MSDVQRIAHIRTPLCFAAAKGDLELVRVLVEAGADVNLYQGDVTPLGTATRSGNVEVMRYLLESGANVQDSTGKSMLAYINQCYLSQHCRLYELAHVDHFSA